MVLEPWMAAEAAKNADERDIEEINRLCDVVEAQILAGEDHMEKDVEFHTAIARSTKNTVIPLIIPIINKSVSMFIEMSGGSLRNETIVTHRSIARAIAEHDSSAAREAMVLHMVIAA